MMEMYFTFTDHIGAFLFKGWSADDAGTLLGICVFVCFLAILAELLSFIAVYIRKKSRVNPLRYGEEEGESEDYPTTLRALLIPPSVSSFRWRKIRLHILQTLNHMFHVIVGYVLMLAIMTYNGYVAIAIVIGATLGYYIFGALKSSYILPSIPPAHHQIHPPPEQIDPSAVSPSEPSISSDHHQHSSFGDTTTEATIESYQRGVLSDSALHSSC